jgi:hypothetical protein
MINFLTIWPQYLLHNLYQPGYMQKNCSHHYCSSHIAHHKKYNTKYNTKHNSLPPLSSLPPPLPPPPPPPLLPSKTMSAIDASNKDISKDEGWHMLDFEALAQDIQNQVSCLVGVAAAEAWHFWDFFGTSRLIVKKVWELLDRNSLLPEGGLPKHLLWDYYFMKVYLKQSPGCLAVGASAGAVNPKTHHKWVWAFINAIANLIDVVVSNHNVRTARTVVFFDDDD